jgi:hypothetical protein
MVKNPSPKAGITEANSAFNMWSDARYPAAAPTLADFRNWMPSTETQDDGVSRGHSRNPLKLI